MTGKNSRWLGAVILGALLGLPGQGSAGPFSRSTSKDCPRPSYTPLHYWTPALYRVYACWHNPFVSLHAPDRAPGIPPSFQIMKYPCPAAEPPALSLEQMRQTLGGEAAVRPEQAR